MSGPPGPSGGGACPSTVVDIKWTTLTAPDPLPETASKHSVNSRCGDGRTVRSVRGREQNRGVAREEYYHDPAAPRANSLAPTAFAAVRDGQGRILLVRRVDTGNWELPGGRVEIGESAAVAAEREVAEESGVRVKVVQLAGVYTDPGHVMVYPANGEVRQQFAVCFHAVALEGEPEPDHDETCEAAWVAPERLGVLPIHPSMRQRIAHAIATDAPEVG
jgi:ADP-ribose pyrophosphatase YjhB (NUDIX family)